MSQALRQRFLPALALSFAVLSTTFPAQAPGGRPLFTRGLDGPPWTVARTLIVADADLDGDLDHVSEAGLQLNDGDGVFAAPVPWLPQLAGDIFRQWGAAADVDGDGFVDVLVGPDKLYRGGPGGALAGTIPLPPVTSSIPGSAIFAPHFFDFDGDGDPDVYAPVKDPANSGLQPAVLWRNDGGMFTDVSATFPSQGYRSQFEESPIIDVDGDGDLDIVERAVAGGVLLNDGAGNFTPDATFPGVPAGTLVADFTLGHFDGDNRADILIHTVTGYVLLLNTPAGWTSVSPGTVFPNAPRFTAVDLEGDGTDELVAVEASGITVYDVNPTGVVSPAQQRFFGDFIAINAGDFDGDGDGDVLAQSDVLTRVFLSDGAGTLMDVHTTRPASFRGRGSVLADANLDGIIDAIGSREDGMSSTIPVVAANDGAGTLGVAGSPQGVAYGQTGGFAFLPIDADLNGAIDAYVVNGQGTPLLTNTPAGLVPSNASVPVVNGVARAVRGDVTGDTVDDIVLGRSGTGPNGAVASMVLVGDGAGGFFVGAQLPPAETRDMDIADYDMDGDLDILEVNIDRAVVWLNDGSGHFPTSEILIPGSSLASGVFLDADGDGDQDVALQIFSAIPGAGFNHSVIVFLQQGPGSFLIVGPVSGLSLDEPTRLTAADLDGDGNQDLIAGCCGAALGDGSGDFPVPVPFGVAAALHYGARLLQHEGAQVADLDRDGDLDVYVDGAVLWNTIRHLELVKPARVGRTARLDVLGPPNEPFVLAVALGTADVPLGPSGVLLLDLATTFVFTQGALDGTGSASFAFPLPTAAGLLGSVLHWQAVVGNAPRLTNRVTSTVLP